MTPSPSLPASRPCLRSVGVTYLDPAATEVFHGTFGMMHVAIKGPEPKLYRGVFAVRAFPVSHPDRFVSLRYVDPLDNREHEIGVIEDLGAFPPAAQALIHESLAKHYYETEIREVREIRWEFNLLFFDVDTSRGRRQFMMRWSYDRAQSYGDHGKVLLDVFENRYVIPNVERLAKPDRELFQRWIYW
ncbi:MAG: DUF1854 domain-containing protein [Verrucomicrobia bacterium]|nr:DUF1854 domain-containing protein [Verrucomicrobiota bacterium]